MRINFYVAALLTAIGLIWFAWTQKAVRSSPAAPAADGGAMPA
jgi:hypothetical protein